MTTDQNKRVLLREKRKAQKRRSFFISGFIVTGIIFVISTIALLPKIFIKHTNYDGNPGFTMGDPNAPIEIIVFSNYSCAYCKVFSDTIEKDFISDLTNAGQIYYRYVNLANNNRLSKNAAKASYCAADQKKFFEYKTYLYTYANAADGFSIENLKKYAKSAGLDTASFITCMSEDTYSQAYLKDKDYAQSVGIRATPTFLVNGQLVKASKLVATVEALLEK